MEITLKELYEYNKKCITEELCKLWTIQKKNDKEYLIGDIPTKEEFLNEFESSILSPWADIVDPDASYREQLKKECEEEIIKVYDEVVKIRDEFVLR